MKKLKFGSRAYREKYLGQKNKKRKYRGLKMAKKKKYSKKGGSNMMSKAFQVLAGAAVAIVYNVFVSPMIPLGNTIKNIIEIVLGIILASSKKMPMVVRAGGFAIATLNAYDLLLPYISGLNKGRR